MVLLSFSFFTLFSFCTFRKFSEISKRSSLCQKKCRHCTLPVLSWFDYSITVTNCDN